MVGMDLSVIKARIEWVRTCSRSTAGAYYSQDVPALVAEVKRLRSYIGANPMRACYEEAEAERDALQVEVERLRAEVQSLKGTKTEQRIRGLHAPVEEEAECWADGDEAMQMEHTIRFPECDPAGCEGHTFKLQVCTECGYTTDGDCVAYRPWPCATLRALAQG